MPVSDLSSNARSAGDESIAAAVQVLRSGGLVAFPTETVYGLGADATRADAVSRIFTAKGRPSTNPLIVHVADAVLARHLRRRGRTRHKSIAGVFWPGPLTLVLPDAPRASADRHRRPGPRRLKSPGSRLGPPTPARIRRSHCRRPSRQSIESSQPDDGGTRPPAARIRVDLVLDGGQCRVGIESTGALARRGSATEAVQRRSSRSFFARDISPAPRLKP